VSDLLDREKILAAMSESWRAKVFALSVVAETDSTQADALVAPTPAEGCAVFLAEQQTAGQGRRGRAWTSPPEANLYMSVSRRFNGDLNALSGLSLAVGVALAEALNASSKPPIALKWPNDLVANGQKLGGILINLRADREGGSVAVIGIGINVRMPGDAGRAIDQPWCDLSQLGFGDTSRNAITANLLEHLLAALDRFERDGLTPFLDRWQELDALVGKPVRVLDGACVHEGISLGITESGALRIRQDEQERAFHSGEVSLRSA